MIDQCLRGYYFAFHKSFAQDQYSSNQLCSKYTGSERSVSSAILGFQRDFFAYLRSRPYERFNLAGPASTILTKELE